MWNEFALEVNS